jgi:hypothetical protein
MRLLSSAPFASFVLLAGLALSGCSCGGSHERGEDTGVRSDAGPETCSGPMPAFCALSCGSDAGMLPICEGGAWRCPPGTVDPSTCPPTCWGPPPGPDCVCDTSGPTPAYVCGSECPPGIMPWNPEDPANACSPEGRSCFSGSASACGAAMSCQCMGGRWTCAVAEPDPACWCGREPTAGGPCTEEGMSCGACCPTPESPAFGPFTCVGGEWVLGDCPAIECPPVVDSCPAVRELGSPCGVEGQTCGDACCSAQTCLGGVWTPGPEADCLCDPGRSFACGAGSCTSDRVCVSDCGPDDGLVHRCDALPSGCTRCDCLALPPGQVCEEIDGHAHVRVSDFCG